MLLQAIREIKILKAINHINIVKLFSIITFVPGDDEEEGVENAHGFCVGDIFMVFEYVDYDLSGLLKCREVVRNYIIPMMYIETNQTYIFLLSIRY